MKIPILLMGLFFSLTANAVTLHEAKSDYQCLRTLNQHLVQFDEQTKRIYGGENSDASSILNQLREYSIDHNAFLAKIEVLASSFIDSRTNTLEDAQRLLESFYSEDLILQNMHEDLLRKELFLSPQIGFVRNELSLIENQLQISSDDAKGCSKSSKEVWNKLSRSIGPLHSEVWQMRDYLKINHTLRVRIFERSRKRIGGHLELAYGQMAGRSLQDLRTLIEGAFSSFKFQEELANWELRNISAASYLTFTMNRAQFEGPQRAALQAHSELLSFQNRAQEANFPESIKTRLLNKISVNLGKINRYLKTLATQGWQGRLEIQLTVLKSFQDQSHLFHDECKDLGKLALESAQKTSSLQQFRIQERIYLDFTKECNL